MKTTHIIKILEQTDYSKLSVEDLIYIRNHTPDCQKCRQAVEAARITSALLKNTALSEAPKPSPYFQSKVLNAWREKENNANPPAFRRWWQASAALVFTMFLAVGGLILFTVLAQTNDRAANEKNSTGYNLYTADSIILNQKAPPDVTAEQAFEIIESSKLTQIK